MIFAPSLIRDIMRVTSHTAESCAYSEDDLMKGSIGNNIFSFINSARNTLKKENPDIVHIHGAWNFKAALVMYLANKQGCLTAISPHCALNHSIINLDFWTVRFLRIVIYQYHMIRHAHAVVAISDDEKEELENLNWSESIDIIESPYVKKISDEQLATQTTTFYQKLKDTYNSRFVTAEEKAFVSKCVISGLYPAEEDFPKELIVDLNATKLNFRRVYIYAHDNKVTELMMRGVRRQNLNVPMRLDTTGIQLMTISNSKSKDFLACKNLCKVIKKVIHGIDITPQTNSKGEISLFTKAEIFEAMRFMEYDEDEFGKQLKEHYITAYTSKLLKEMQKDFALQEGFIPMMP